MSSLQGLMERLDVKLIRPAMRPLREEIGDVNELAGSIREKGLLNPIVVRPIGSGFEVVAGHRRFEACKLLGWRRIPCQVISLDDKEAYEVSLVENLQYRTLNPLEEAKAFRRYIDDYGFGSATELAQEIGKSPSYVSRTVHLLDLPDSIQQLLRMRKGHDVAQELVSLDREDAMRLGELIVTNNLTRGEVRQFKRVIKRHRRAEKSRKGSIYTIQENNIHTIDVSINRCITSLKLCLARLSEEASEVEDHFAIEETLRELRFNINQQLDCLLKARKKIHLVKFVCDEGEIVSEGW